MLLRGGFNSEPDRAVKQAVTCLKAKGIPLVIAASFSQTYLRNAYNNGFLCVEVPEFIGDCGSNLPKRSPRRENDHFR